MHNSYINKYIYIYHASLKLATHVCDAYPPSLSPHVCNQTGACFTLRHQDAGMSRAS